MSITKLGIPVDAAESRTAAVCINEAGDSRVVIAAKGFLLVVDIESGECTQFPFPDGNTEYPYDCFASRNGMFYVGAGNWFYALDPFQLIYVATLQISQHRDELCGFSYAENLQGHIYFSSYPACRLYRYRPDEQDLTCYGSMDSEQKYPSYMAVDAYDWVYLGIGTAKKNIVAYHPQRRERRTLLNEGLRDIGIGQVIQGEGHQVYALIGEQWAIVEQGVVIERLSDNQFPASLYTGTSFDKFHRQLQGKWRLLSHSLSNRELHLKHMDSDQVKVIQLAYKSEGAALSTLTSGPDSCIYGTSMHPLHFYSYDPHARGKGEDQDRLINWGPHVIQHGFGGNIAAYTVQGVLLIGAAYPEGRLHLYDVTRPIQTDKASLLANPNSQPSMRNPLCVSSHAEIFRPRCVVALRDQEHVVYGGFPGYGMVGGALCIYHLQSGEEWLIPNSALIEGQSTVSLVEAITDGVLIGGTSIETPGGAEPKAYSACVYTLDLKKRSVMQHWILREDVREYTLLLAAPNGWIHTITSCSKYLVWDPGCERLIHEVDLSSWGKVLHSSWLLSVEEECIYGVMGYAIFRIPLDSLQPERLFIPEREITAGLAKVDHELYFAMSAVLCRYSIKEG